jgi:pimeloyl-ACP methyl ester carboxylesterase
VAATARWLKKETDRPVSVAGRGRSALIAAYAAVLEPEIEGVVAIDPPATHMDAFAPQFLNVLRVCDAPVLLGLLAPRPLKLVSRNRDSWAAVAACYKAAGANEKFALIQTRE